MNKLIILLSMLLMTGFHAQAIEAPSLSLGKTLFEATELGSKGRSCTGCHSRGKGLDMVGVAPLDRSWQMTGLCRENHWYLF